MHISDFLNKLEGVKKTGKRQWTAKCPSHGDKRNSMAVGCDSSGKILLKCFAGCEASDMVSAIGLKMADLMPDDDNWKNDIMNKPVVTSYRWETLDGNCKIEHRREDYQNGKKNFFWFKNGKISKKGTDSSVSLSDLKLYPAFRGAPSSDWCCICEGEKAAHAAARLGFDAYSTPGASWKPTVDALRPVCSGRNVILWADNDAPGRKHMDAVAKVIENFATSIEVITTGKDKDDAADFNGTKDDVIRLVSGRLTQMHCEVFNVINDLNCFSRGDIRDMVTTGIGSLNKALTGGMQTGAVYLIGAASGGGKTTFLQCVAAHVAREHGAVLFVSPEMSARSLAQREVIRRSGFPMSYRAPWSTEWSWQREKAEEAHNKAAAEIANEMLPVYIIDDIETSLSDAEKYARKIKDLKLIILDYAQELADDSGGTARYLAVGEVGKTAIRIGRELNCPVMIASQVNCAKDKFGNTEYTFRESQKLEHKCHASMILEVQRDINRNEHGFYDVTGASLVFRKNRDGAMPKIELDYKPAIFHFGDKPEEAVYNQEQESEFTDENDGFVF